MRPLTLLLGSAWLLGTVGASAMAIQGCGSSSCEESQTCGAVGDGAVGEGGLDSGADGAPVLEGGPPPGCDLAKEPKDSAPCVTELVGVFVSPLGDDGAEGSRNKPVKTIGKGLELLADRGRVYICEGTYAETVTLTKTVSLYGGWSCGGGTWAYTGKKPTVRSAAGSAALTLKSAKDVVVADVAFEASDATAKGGSSIAGFASNSSARLVRDSFTAGAGQPGEDGPATVAPFSPATSASGNPGTTSGGNRLANPLCPTTAGGFGGGPTAGGAPGATGEPLISPSVPGSASGLGGTPSDCSATSPTGGRAGSHGAAGLAGIGAGISGALTAISWQVEGGKSGGVGGAGQGGGGGGSTETTYGGGGGAPGGCGGAAGGAGSGGGGSIAFISFASAIAFEGTGLTSAQAGKGGNGGVGQIGQAGGFGGGTQSAAACLGGKGGAGGGGGGGGGGAGGLSVGILWSGTAPTFNGAPVQNTLKPAGITVAATAAAGGTKGSGGAAAVTGSLPGADGTDGKPGVSQATLGL